MYHIYRCTQHIYQIDADRESALNLEVHRKQQTPKHRWMYMGPGGSRTPLHVDPCLTHAWLFLTNSYFPSVYINICVYKPLYIDEIYD